MALWSLRKIQVFVFYAARTSNETSYGRGFEDIAGLAGVSLLMAIVALTLVCGGGVALHRQISQHALLQFSHWVFWISVGFNYFTLLFRGQWRRYAQDFRNLTADDLTFTTIGVFILAFAWAAWLVFWAGDVASRSP
jgi:hypothetical protein